MDKTSHLLDIADDICLSLVTSEPFIKISDNIHTDLTSQSIAGLWSCRGGQDKAGEEENYLQIVKDGN